MRAAWYEREGAAADVLTVGEKEKPVPGPSQVLVKVAWSGINPTDVKGRSGATPRPIDEFQVPHMDGSGVIAEVGEGVDPARVGQRVWLFFAAAQNRWGTAAEFCVVPEAQAVALPDGADLELGACLGVPALTAYEVLTHRGPIHGQTVLVQGSGAVGHYAVQLARWMGATVIATAGSDEKVERALHNGAHHAVSYRAADAAEQITAIAPVDLVVEVDLVTNWDLDLAVARTGGSIVTYATDDRPLEVVVRQAMTLNLDLRFFLLYTRPFESLTRAAQGLHDAMVDGAITTLPMHPYGLDDIVAAQERVDAEQPGKTVLDLSR